MPCRFFELYCWGSFLGLLRGILLHILAKDQGKNMCSLFSRENKFHGAANILRLFCYSRPHDSHQGCTPTPIEELPFFQHEPFSIWRWAVIRVKGILRYLLVGSFSLLRLHDAFWKSAKCTWATICVVVLYTNLWMDERKIIRYWIYCKIKTWLMGIMLIHIY